MCSILVTSFAEMKNYHGFGKGPHVKIRYLPVWTEEEIKRFCDASMVHMSKFSTMNVPNKDTVIANFMKLGEEKNYHMCRHITYNHLVHIIQISVQLTKRRQPHHTNTHIWVFATSSAYWNPQASSQLELCKYQLRYLDKVTSAHPSDPWVGTLQITLPSPPFILPKPPTGESSKKSSSRSLHMQGHTTTIYGKNNNLWLQMFCKLMEGLSPTQEPPSHTQI